MQCAALTAHEKPQTAIFTKDFDADGQLFGTAAMLVFLLFSRI